jgi:hypothetical protein
MECGGEVVALRERQRRLTPNERLEDVVEIRRCGTWMKI